MSRTNKRKLTDEDPDENKNNNEEIIDDIIFINCINEITNKRGFEKTCWPSEIPRLYLKLKNWRNYLNQIRLIAINMCINGDIDILQKGIVCTLTSSSSLKGPIRLRMKKK